MEPFTLVRHATGFLAWSNRWPGLLAGGETEEEVAGRLPLALAEYGHWLASHGEAGPGAEFMFSGHLDWREADASGRDPCLPADCAPLSGADRARFLRHIELSQLDLQLAADVPTALLDWLPEGVEPERPDPWAPDTRTIRAILTHALQFEVFYRGGLADGPAPGIFERVGTPTAEQAATLERVGRAALAEPGRVFHPERFNPARAATEPDEWTVRKAVRRLVSHNRAHAAEILQRRTWVLIGPPR